MSRIWSRDPRAVWRRSGDRVIVLPAAAERPLVLTGTGRVSWELLADPLTEGELIATLVELYGTDEETIGRELLPFLQELVTAGAVADR
jgi:hypothetical protein